MARQYKYPPSNTKISSLARFLTSNAMRFNGKIPIEALFSYYPKMGRDWVDAGCRQLRNTYSYYCAVRRGFVFCAMRWPDAGYGGEPTNTDPRLSAPPVKYKYRKGDDKDTLLYTIRTYVLRHRSPGTHVLDAAWLFQKYGTRRIMRYFAVLNKSYGFHIRKLNKGKPDGLWVVDRDRNFQIPTDAVLEAYGHSCKECNGNGLDKDGEFCLACQGSGIL